MQDTRSVISLFHPFVTLFFSVSHVTEIQSLVFDFSAVSQTSFF